MTLLVTANACAASCSSCKPDPDCKQEDVGMYQLLITVTVDESFHADMLDP